MKNKQIAKEAILYLVFGVLTTVVNIAVYFLSTNCLSFSVVISNILAWFVSVLFAYVTNRIWVFESKSTGVKNILAEVSTFFGGRIGTGALDTLLMYVSVEMFLYNDLVMKIAVNVIVIIANYLISKFFVFRKKDGTNNA